MVQRVYMDGYRMVTRDASGNVTFTTDKTYVKTDVYGDVNLSLMKSGFAATNPIFRNTASNPPFMGQYAGYPAAILLLDKPDQQLGSRYATWNLPSFPVNGYFVFKGCKCSADDYTPEQIPYLWKNRGGINFGRDYYPWMILRNGSYVALVHATIGQTDTKTETDPTYGGQYQVAEWVIYGGGSFVSEGQNLSSDLIIQVSAFETLQVRPLSLLADFTYQQPVYYGKGQPTGYQTMTYPTNLTAYILVQFFAYDKDLPLSLTL